MSRPTLVTVNLANIADNFRLISGLSASEGFVCPMIKADAYGHGAIRCAEALRSAGARQLGVALIEEGIELRIAGDTGPILVFGTFLDDSSAHEIVRHNLISVVSSWSQLDILSKQKTLSGSRIRIHLKFNTGMNRLGFLTEDASRIRTWLNNHPEIVLEGLCTHLMSGEDAGQNDGRSQAQLALFKSVLAHFRDLNVPIHALNSSASIAVAKRVSSELPFGMRPGISLYGAQPSERAALRLDLKPALRWTSEVVAVNRVSVGEGVSYDGTWRATRQSVVGVVPVGYADGYSRTLSNRGFVLFRGLRLPIVGTVCMDYLMIDMTDAVPGSDDSQVLGGEVVLIGDQQQAAIGAEEIAALSGTISYEVFTRISARVPRRYLAAGEHRKENTP